MKSWHGYKQGQWKWKRERPPKGSKRMWETRRCQYKCFQTSAADPSKSAWATLCLYSRLLWVGSNALLQKGSNEPVYRPWKQWTEMWLLQRTKLPRSCDLRNIQLLQCAELFLVQARETPVFSASIPVLWLHIRSSWEILAAMQLGLHPELPGLIPQGCRWTIFQQKIPK